MILSAGWITLAGSIAAILITLWLIRQAAHKEPTDAVTTRLYRIRRRYFIILSMALVALLLATLPMAPYRAGTNTKPDVIVPVVGRIWSWQIGPLKDGEGNQLAPDGNGVTLPVGKIIAFHVTSEDVNHGFGIYDETGSIIAQTQAMPGYVNKLVHTFSKPGTYHVLCMEYCGIAHHSMITTFRVE